MFPVMKAASKLNGYIFCVLSAVMLLYSVPKVVTFAEKDMDTVSLYFNGQLSREFEKDYDKKLFIRDTSIEYWANLQYWLFKEGLDGVVIGDQGWLYTKEEFGFIHNVDLLVERHFQRVLEVKQSLAEKGKTLVVLPVPMKLDIYSEYTPYDFKQPAERLYTQFITLLNEFHVLNSPIRDGFLNGKDEQQLFLKRDTHWTPAGAELAAKSLARQFPELVGETEFVTQKVDDNDLLGDLVNFIKVSRWVDSSLYADETIPAYETVKAVVENEGDALFGDEAAPVALVGTSYTAIDDWNFPGFVKQHLKTNLVSTAVKEKGPFVAMDKFFKSEAIDDESIETVIWEFPVRVLLTADQQRSAWKSVLDDIF